MHTPEDKKKLKHREKNAKSPEYARKNGGQIRSLKTVGGLNKGFWPKYIPLDDSLLDGFKFKSEVVNELLKYTGYDPRDTSPLNAYSVVP